MFVFFKVGACVDPVKAGALLCGAKGNRRRAVEPKHNSVGVSVAAM